MFWVSNWISFSWLPLVSCKNLIIFAYTLGSMQGSISSKDDSTNLEKWLFIFLGSLFVFAHPLQVSGFSAVITAAAAGVWLDFSARPLSFCCLHGLKIDWDMLSKSSSSGRRLGETERNRLQSVKKEYKTYFITFISTYTFVATTASWNGPFAAIPNGCAMANVPFKGPVTKKNAKLQSFLD